MIKILSSWSRPGGSTVAFIRLCNLFNDKGLNCEFYGPHDWHLNQCRGKQATAFNPHETDILISHFMIIKEDIPRKRHILSLHETNLFNLQDLDTMNLTVDLWDAIHYVSNSQRAFHSVNKAYKIIPNIVERLEYVRPKVVTGCAGVIGSVDSHKQTHLSIQRALDQGFKTVKVFGHVTDIPYALENKDIIYHKNVEIMGWWKDQGKMYQQVDKVFHSSKRETFNYIKAECEQIGMPYDGLESAESGAEVWDKNKIFDAWTHLLELKI